MWNSRGHFELDGDIGGRSGCGEPRRVIQQYLVRATLDQQRRDPAQNGNNGLSAPVEGSPAPA